MPGAIPAIIAALGGSLPKANNYMTHTDRARAIRGYEARIKELETRIKEYRDEINRLNGQRPIQEF